MLGKENMQQLLINMNVINNKLYAIVVKASKILEGYIKDKDRLLFFFFFSLPVLIYKYYVTQKLSTFK